MANRKRPTIRRGVTKLELLDGAYVKDWLQDRPDHFSALQRTALDAFGKAVDELVSFINAGNAVGMSDVTTFFADLEHYCQCRHVINHNIKTKKLTPTVLDEIAGP